MARLDELPDDPALLKRLLTERDVLIERIKEEAADRLAEQAERIKPEAAEQLEALRLRMEVEKKAAIAVEVKAAVDAVVRRFHRPRSDGSMLVNCCCSVSVSKSCRSTSQASQKKRAKS